MCLHDIKMKRLVSSSMLKFELIFSLEVEFKLLVLPLDVSRHGTTDPQKRSDFFSSFFIKHPTLFLHLSLISLHFWGSPTAWALFWQTSSTYVYWWYVRARPDENSTQTNIPLICNSCLELDGIGAGAAFHLTKVCLPSSRWFLCLQQETGHLRWTRPIENKPVWSANTAERQWKWGRWEQQLTLGSTDC